eukprot:1183842-Prorocentrum_minimum.AAC.4
MDCGPLAQTRGPTRFAQGTMRGYSDTMIGYPNAGAGGRVRRSEAPTKGRREAARRLRVGRRGEPFKRLHTVGRSSLRAAAAGAPGGTKAPGRSSWVPGNQGSVPGRNVSPRSRISEPARPSHVDSGPMRRSDTAIVTNI